MFVTVTLNSGYGISLGPKFFLIPNVGYATPFEASISELLAGKVIEISDSATELQVISNGACENGITLIIGAPPTTTAAPTTTTTTTAAPTTTTTTTTAAPTTAAPTTTTTTTTAAPNTFNVTANGSSNYVINGSSNPTLSITEGETYTFNINASGHPFWIKTVSSTGTGNSYSSGVTNNGTDNGTITFVVPYDAPSTLYYNCQLHSAMAGTINVTDVPTTTTTTTTTTTAAPPATSTLTFEFIGSTFGTSTFKFTLSNPLSVDLTITSATVNLYSDYACGVSDGQASNTTSGTIYAGALEVSIPGPTTCPQSYSPNGAITISGIGTAGHNSTFNAGGTDVTLLYDTTECNIPLCDS